MNEKRVDDLLSEYAELSQQLRWLSWLKEELKEVKVKGYSVYLKRLAMHVQNRIVHIDELLNEEEEFDEVG